MATGLVLESSFLIDYERELARSEFGPSQRFLARNESASLCVTPTITGELAAGQSLRNRERWDDFLTGFRVLDLGPDVCWEYGRIHRYLRANGMLIGANDLWIAAAGIAYELPVVTRNERDFARVPNLEVLTY